jgi:hypothetical protein
MVILFLDFGSHSKTTCALSAKSTIPSAYSIACNWRPVTGTPSPGAGCAKEALQPVYEEGVPNSGSPCFTPCVEGNVSPCSPLGWTRCFTTEYIARNVSRYTPLTPNDQRTCHKSSLSRYNYNITSHSVHNLKNSIPSRIEPVSSIPMDEAV